MSDRLRFTGPRSRRVAVTQHEELKPAHNNGSPILKQVRRSTLWQRIAYALHVDLIVAAWAAWRDRDRDLIDHSDEPFNPYEGGSAGYVPMAALLLAIVVCASALAWWGSPDSASASEQQQTQETQR